MRISDWSSDVCSSDLSVTDALSNILGQETRNRPGRKHILDEAYFARIEAIQFTIAHDDGVGHETWEEADILLAGVSRASKTPTSSEERSEGKECVSTCSSLSTPSTLKNNQLTIIIASTITKT